MKVMEKNYVLANMRERKGYLQEDMAKRLNISKSAYSDKEVGRSEFKSSEMIKIAKIFNVTLNDIFWKETMEEKLNGEDYL